MSPFISRGRFVIHPWVGVGFLLFLVASGLTLILIMMSLLNMV